MTSLRPSHVTSPCSTAELARLGFKRPTFVELCSLNSKMINRNLFSQKLTSVYFCFGTAVTVMPRLKSSRAILSTARGLWAHLQRTYLRVITRRFLTVHNCTEKKGALQLVPNSFKLAYTTTERFMPRHKTSRCKIEVKIKQAVYTSR